MNCTWAPASMVTLSTNSVNTYVSNVGYQSWWGRGFSARGGKSILKTISMCVQNIGNALWCTRHHWPPIVVTFGVEQPDCGKHVLLQSSRGGFVDRNPDLELPMPHLGKESRRTLGSLGNWNLNRRVWSRPVDGQQKVGVRFQVVWIFGRLTRWSAAFTNCYKMKLRLYSMKLLWPWNSFLVLLPVFSIWVDSSLDQWDVHWPSLSC